MRFAEWRVLALAAVVVSLILMPGTPARAQSLSLTLRETIPIPPGIVNVFAIHDLDGDGILDLLVYDHGAGWLHVLERDGLTFTTRYSYYIGDYYTNFAAGDLDGDGLLEFSAKTSFGGDFYIFESTGNDSYALSYFQHLGHYPEATNVGDSDGDGRLEFLVTRETFPSEVHRFEAIADNTYVELPTLYGAGGNCYFGGTADLDGDGAPETVFSDDHYNVFAADVYVFENDVLVYQDPTHSMLVWAIGDTDGNGLGEIVGRDRLFTTGWGVYSDKLRVLESTGSGNGFAEVFFASSDYSYYLRDVDRDGQSEFWRTLDVGNGQKDVLALAHRAGSVISDYYDTGSLLQGLGDIVWTLPLDDTNGDGHVELAVFQGGNIHILEVGTTPACSIEALVAAIEEAGLPLGTRRSLVSKVEAAAASYENGNDTAGNNQLAAFIHEVEALRGKKIDDSVADALIGMVECLIGGHSE